MRLPDNGKPRRLWDLGVISRVGLYGDAAAAIAAAKILNEVFAEGAT